LSVCYAKLGSGIFFHHGAPGWSYLPEPLALAVGALPLAFAGAFLAVLFGFAFFMTDLTSSNARSAVRCGATRAQRLRGAADS